MTIEGPNSRFPIVGISKRQGCVSNSTPEAEMVAGHFGLRSVMVPGLDLWTALFPKAPRGVFHEDNQAMIRVCETGKNPTMRHLGRTHGVSVAWLHEQLAVRKLVDLEYTDSNLMAADIYTKAFTDADRWEHALLLITLFTRTR